jgi:hypothetical protein
VEECGQLHVSDGSLSGDKSKYLLNKGLGRLQSSSGHGHKENCGLAVQSEVLTLLV